MEQGNAGINAGTWEFFSWILQNVMYPHAALWGYFAVAIQVILALAFIFGLFARPMALVGLSLDLFIMMLGNSRIPPFFSLGHLFILGTNAGMYYGIDAWLMKRYSSVKTTQTKLLTAVLTLNFVTPGIRHIIASACAVLAVYFLLELAVIETGKIKM
ncbi:DoxX family membrane protein [Desulfoscipio gibsoniae]|nr:DoxX family membrane protein [Desulfoscipio gibsoniae]